MTVDLKTVKCGKCRVPLKLPAEGDTDTDFSCPKCGRKDGRDAVLREVSAFIEDATAQYLNEGLKRAARGSKFMKVVEKPRHRRTYRYVVDLNFH